MDRIPISSGDKRRKRKNVYNALRRARPVVPSVEQVLENTTPSHVPEEVPFKRELESEILEVGLRVGLRKAITIAKKNSREIFDFINSNFGEVPKIKSFPDYPNYVTSHVEVLRELSRAEKYLKGEKGEPTIDGLSERLRMLTDQDIKLSKSFEKIHARSDLKSAIKTAETNLKEVTSDPHLAVPADISECQRTL